MKFTSLIGTVVGSILLSENAESTSAPTSFPTPAVFSTCNGFAVEHSTFHIAYPADVCLGDTQTHGNNIKYHCHSATQMEVLNYTGADCSGDSAVVATITENTMNSVTGMEYSFDCSNTVEDTSCYVSGVYLNYNDSTCETSTSSSSRESAQLLDYCIGFEGKSFKFTCDGTTPNIEIYSGTECEGTAAASGDSTTCVSATISGETIGLKGTVSNNPCSAAFNSKQLSLFNIFIVISLLFAINKY